MYDKGNFDEKGEFKPGLLLLLPEVSSSFSSFFWYFSLWYSSDRRRREGKEILVWLSRERGWEEGKSGKACVSSLFSPPFSSWSPSGSFSASSSCLGDDGFSLFSLRVTVSLVLSLSSPLFALSSTSFSSCSPFSSDCLFGRNEGEARYWRELLSFCSSSICLKSPCLDISSSYDPSSLISPSCMTRMRSEFLMMSLILSLIIMLVLFAWLLWIPISTSKISSGEMRDMTLSKIKIFDCLRTAFAIAILCFCPVVSFIPFNPMSVCIWSSLKVVTNSLQLETRAAWMTSLLTLVLLAIQMLSWMVPSKTIGFFPTNPRLNRSHSRFRLSTSISPT